MGRRTPFLRSAALSGTGRAESRSTGGVCVEGGSETEEEAASRQVVRAVLFASGKPLDRAENLKAVYDVYDGPKAFAQVDPWRRHPEISSGKYAVLVIDEFPTESPGKCIAIGHGFAGGKTSGFEQPHPYIRQKDADLITYAITSGTAMMPIVARYSGLTESQVLPLGMPRTDAYKCRKKGDGGTRLAGKRAYLYAPTYRSPEETPMPDIEWAWLDKNLEDGEILAVKPHTMTGRILPPGRWKHIVEFPAYESSAPFLYDCDVVITDYSTIMFDAYLLGKPVVLFEKVKGYVQTRGMYLDYPDQYSSRYCTNEETLLTMLRCANGLCETEEKCIQLVADACDGHSAVRVCSLIRSLL